MSLDTNLLSITIFARLVYLLHGGDNVPFVHVNMGI